MRQRLQKARPAAAARLGKTDISLASSRKRPVRYRYRQRFGRGWRVQADSRLDRRYAQNPVTPPALAHKWMAVLKPDHALCGLANVRDDIFCFVRLTLDNPGYSGR